jgi:hypothetical protein
MATCAAHQTGKASIAKLSDLIKFKGLWNVIQLGIVPLMVIFLLDFVEWRMHVHSCDEMEICDALLLEIRLVRYCDAAWKNASKFLAAARQGSQ